MSEDASRIEELEKRVEKIQKSRGSYRHLLDFFKKLFSSQVKTSPHVTLDEDDLRADLVERKLREGFPILPKETIRVDLDSAQELFQTLSRITKEENRYLGEEFERIESAFQDKKLILRELLESFGKEGKTLDAESGLPLLTLLLRYSVQPSLKAISSFVESHVDLGSWEKGYCPVCGSPPYLSVLRGEGGERSFFCCHCGHEWKARRLFCPFCETVSPEKLRYLYAETESEYRIDLCDNCKRYIKTVDARKLEGPVIPDLEFISTLHLDILAEEEGFEGTNPIPDLFPPPSRKAEK